MAGPPQRPVAIIENGSRNNQIAVKGRLGDLSTIVSAASVTGPAILVIGEAAARADAGEILALAREDERRAA